MDINRCQRIYFYVKYINRYIYIYIKITIVCGILYFISFNVSHLNPHIFTYIIHLLMNIYIFKKQPISIHKQYAYINGEREREGDREFTSLPHNQIHPNIYIYTSLKRRLAA